MEELLIFPFNGNGIEALDCIQNQFDFIGFIDDTPEKQGKNPMGFTVYSRSILEKYPASKVLAVPGSPLNFRTRNPLIDSLKIPDSRFAKVIHSKANISPLAVLGFNVLIMAGAVITSNVTIGNHVIILPNTVIHHDCKVGDYTLIGSNICVAGRTLIGRNCYIGSGSNIINDIEIGDESLIGLGSNVIRNVAPRSKVAGNPIKLL